MRSQKRFQSEPPGTIKPYAGEIAPAGYLFCDGSAISRIGYARLFVILSSNYGGGDGITTFNVPDMRGRLPLGKDNMGGASANRVTATHADNLGQSGGEEKHSPVTAETANHSHQEDSRSGTSIGGGLNYNWSALGGGIAGYTDTADTGQSQAFNVMQPSQTTNYIIKV